MSKFKVGDKAVRIGCPPSCLAGFDVVTVSCVSSTGTWLGVEEYTNPQAATPFPASLFELVATGQPTEVPALTPVEVLECIINDVPVQYQTDSSTNWVDLHSNPDRVSFYVPYTYRKKPSTVKINATEVVQPKLDNAVKYSQKCYTFSEGLQTVIEARPSFVADSKLYWDTREDAWAALKAITAILRGE